MDELFGILLKSKTKLLLYFHVVNNEANSCIFSLSWCYMLRNAKEEVSWFCITILAIGCSVQQTEMHIDGHPRSGILCVLCISTPCRDTCEASILYSTFSWRLLTPALGDMPHKRTFPSLHFLPMIYSLLFRNKSKTYVSKTNFT